MFLSPAGKGGRQELQEFKLSLRGATGLAHDAVSTLLRLPVLTELDVSGCSRISAMDKMRLVAKVCMQTSGADEMHLLRSLGRALFPHRQGVLQRPLCQKLSTIRGSLFCCRLRLLLAAPLLHVHSRPVLCPNTDGLHAVGQHSPWTSWERGQSQVKAGCEVLAAQARRAGRPVGAGLTGDVATPADHGAFFRGERQVFGGPAGSGHDSSAGAAARA